MRYYSPSLPVLQLDPSGVRIVQWVSGELQKLAQALESDESPVGDTNLADDDVGLLVFVNRAGVLAASRVTIGAVNSGGAGYRLLRVEN